MELKIIYPPAEQAELARRVARLHAEAALAYVERQPCAAAQKLAALEQLLARLSQPIS